MAEVGAILKQSLIFTPSCFPFPSKCQAAPLKRSVTCWDTPTTASPRQACALLRKELNRTSEIPARAAKNTSLEEYHQRVSPYLGDVNTRESCLHLRCPLNYHPQYRLWGFCSPNSHPRCRFLLQTKPSASSPMAFCCG